MDKKLGMMALILMISINIGYCCLTAEQESMLNTIAINNNVSEDTLKSIFFDMCNNQTTITNKLNSLNNSISTEATQRANSDSLLMTTINSTMSSVNTTITNLNLDARISETKNWTMNYTQNYMKNYTEWWENQTNTITNLAIIAQIINLSYSPEMFRNETMAQVETRLTNFKNMFELRLQSIENQFNSTSNSLITGNLYQPQQQDNTGMYVLLGLGVAGIAAFVWYTNKQPIKRNPIEDNYLRDKVYSSFGVKNDDNTSRSKTSRKKMA